MNKNYLNPAETAAAVIEAGRVKGERSFFSLLVLGILAGAFIAFAGQGSTMASFNLLSDPETFGLGRCLLGAVFTVGLMLVVVSGAELFTGNTLMCLTVLEKKTTIRKMLRNWGLVYLGNFIGAILIAWMVCKTGLWSSGGDMLGAMTVKIALGKVNLSFLSAMISGILCNWLVCMAVWMSMAADTIISKLAAVFFPIWLFATSGFEHSIANMYYIPAGILAKSAYGSFFEEAELASLNWQNFFAGNLLPVTIGNIIGGAVFTGFALWLGHCAKTGSKVKVK